MQQSGSQRWLPTGNECFPGLLLALPQVPTICGERWEGDHPAERRLSRRGAGSVWPWESQQSQYLCISPKSWWREDTEKEGLAAGGCGVGREGSSLCASGTESPGEATACQQLLALPGCRLLLSPAGLLAHLFSSAPGHGHLGLVAQLRTRANPVVRSRFPFEVRSQLFPPCWPETIKDQPEGFSSSPLQHPEHDFSGNDTSELPLKSESRVRRDPDTQETCKHSPALDYLPAGIQHHQGGLSGGLRACGSCWLECGLPGREVGGAFSVFSGLAPSSAVLWLRCKESLCFVGWRSKGVRIAALRPLHHCWKGLPAAKGGEDRA